MNHPIDHAAALEFLAYDHRASIVGYLNDQATSFELKGHKNVADVLRAQASNISIQMDVRQGTQGIASPVDAIILECCAAFGGTNHLEVTGSHGGNDATKRVRIAAMWVAKKRLRTWTDDQLANHFKRDRSSVSHGVKRGEELRTIDLQFRRITDRLADHPPLRCENCQHALEPIT
jgi:hypothetical protein